MKAAVLTGVRNISCEEIPTPEPQENEVLVRVAYCGVCGSDVPRYLDGAVHAFPLILGHEFSGQVEAIGAGVDPSLAGARVAGIPLIPCMECPDCMAGNYSLCKRYSFIGSRRAGAYAQYVAVPAVNVLPVSDDVGYLEAAFFEPASVAQHAIDLVDPRPGSTACVSGCGTIGIFLVQLLQARGLDVTALARRKSRIDAALEAGVARICDTSQDDWDDRLRTGLVRGGFDYVFDTSGSNLMMVKSLELAANKATVCMVGTPKRPMELSVREWENLNRKELTLKGSWMSYSAPWPGGEWDQVAARFADGTLRVVDSMIDTVCILDDIASAMEKFATSNSVSGKIVIDCR